MTFITGEDVVRSETSALERIDRFNKAQAGEKKRALSNALVLAKARDLARAVKEVQPPMDLVDYFINVNRLVDLLTKDDD